MLGTLDKVQILRQVSLFRGIRFDDLATLSQILKLQEAKAGTIIFRRHDPGDALFIVIDGDVDILLDGDGDEGEDEVPIARIGKFGHFGDMALLDDQPRSATARVAGDAWLFRIEKDEFRRLLAEHIDLPLELLRIFSERIRQLDQDVHGTK